MSRLRGQSGNVLAADWWDPSSRAGRSAQLPLWIAARHGGEHQLAQRTLPMALALEEESPHASEEDTGQPEIADAGNCGRPQDDLSETRIRV
jgi:hypothetical protein